MATAYKNTSADPNCPHSRALEHSCGIDDYRITQKVCTNCRRVVAVHVTNPPETSPQHEDAQYPAYWDSSPDINTARGLESLRRLAWSIIGVTIVFACAALEII